MKKNIILLSIAMLSVLVMTLGSSCSEHVDDLEHFNVSVGDILLSNNRIIQPRSYNTGIRAVGVVMHTSNDSVWIVSAKEMADKNYLDTLMEVSNVSSGLTSLDGRENTASILLSGRNSSASTAVQQLDVMTSVYGWYLPSIGEMRLLSNSLGIVTTSMNLIGGDAFSSAPYLSSSQDGSSTETRKLYAYCITLQSGLVSSLLKTEYGHVRGVLRMKMR